MCLIVFAWQPDAAHSLVVAANRDEWRERPTARLHWWDHEPARSDSEYSQPLHCDYSPGQARTGILAGRDLKDGGTWMGVTASGRFAALTNFRDPRNVKPGAPSRGALVRAFLEGNVSPCEYLQSLAERMADFNGFNLLVGDRDELWWVSNRGGAPMAVTPGVHGLSNGLLDEQWPKVARAKERLTDALEHDSGDDALWALLADDAAAPDDELPDTGVGLDWERRLSPALIRGDHYGTRSSALLRVFADGRLRLSERTCGGDCGDADSEAGVVAT
ncbi:MAG: NRDE family protein [Burkholderiales bacterium]|nr:NRDE family protein [Burkholderiales bacterium]